MERGLGPLRPEISEHTAYVLGTTRHQIPGPYANFRAPLPVTGLEKDYVRAKKQQCRLFHYFERRGGTLP